LPRSIAPEEYAEGPRILDEGERFKERHNPGALVSNRPIWARSSAARRLRRRRPRRSDWRRNWAKTRMCSWHWQERFPATS